MHRKFQKEIFCTENCFEQFSRAQELKTVSLATIPDIMKTKYFVEVLFKKNGGKWQRRYSDVTGAYNLAEDGAGFDEVKQN